MEILNYSDTFDCCGNKRYLLDMEYIKIKYYSMLHTKNSFKQTKAFSNELFGKRDSNWLDVSDIHYLWNLMVIMRREKELYETQYGLGIVDEEPENTYYRDKYNLECIRKTFKCKGIDILPLLRLIDLDYVIQRKDGIDYMAIVPNLTDKPDFRVS